MPLYEKFGLDSELFTKDDFEYTKESILTGLNIPPDDTYLFRSNKQSLVFDSSKICFDYYMVEEKNFVEHYALPMLNYTLDYFFGEWRKTNPIDGKVGEEFLKSSVLWLDDFRESILWASVLGQWKKAKEISKYPDDLCMEADFETKEKKAWYIVLAIYLREGSLAKAEKYVELIEKGKKKREKLLLIVLRAIIANDAESFAKEFGVYMKHYKAREYPQDQVPEKLAIDGTILFNLAKYKGMQVEFPEKYIDHYVHLD